ncbi:Kynurenine 3-monooxygenase [Beauveria bassiana]|nr:Kynurenine 3-monooxygenase [Beauveria bassiana]
MASPHKVVVVGGGPVGALSALYAARRGYAVELYELRDDPNYGSQSARPDIAVIPLALSERGIRAIAEAGVPGLLDRILDNSRPIDTRMIHTRDSHGNIKNIPMVYGPQGQCLHTLPRQRITKHVMLALMDEPNAKLFFNQRLTSCNFDAQVATFESVVWKNTAEDGEKREASKPMPVETSQTTSVEFDFLIGADGTYSSVRQFMMRKSCMDFSQEYLQALWCDFIFPAAPDGSYRMQSTCLHVWPADESIVMCQPDFDGSFRAGMVCDTAKVRYYEAHPDEFAAFFDNEFPGIIPRILSAEAVTEQFLAHQKIPLKSVKCGQLGYKDCVVLLGDSSHSMTPFHAMGMMTGLEDVRIFFREFRDRAGLGDPSKPFCTSGTVEAYSRHRLPDVHAMVDMATEHYYELRVGVRSTAARTKKVADAFLSRWVPSLDWTTLYARIQFGHERFTVVREKEAMQKKITQRVLAGAGGLLAAMAFASVMKLAEVVYNE